MSNIEQKTDAFILRVWLEPREIPETPEIWRGVVEHVSSGAQHYFDDLSELAEIVQTYVNALLPVGREASATNEGQPMETYSDIPLDTGVQSPQGQTSTLGALHPALIRLDRLLAAAVVTAQTVYGPEVADDPYRGLHVSADEVERLLAREPAAPVLAPDRDTPTRGAGSIWRRLPKRFAWLGRWFDRKPAERLEGPVQAEAEIQRTEPSTREEVEITLPLVVDADLESPLMRLARQHGLTSFDMDIMLIAMAPDLDLRYERLYAYLQDDVSRRRASVDLALNLLCADVNEKLARRAHFAPGSPLVESGILHLISDRDDGQSPLLSRFISVDSQVLRFLIGEPTLDSRLAPFCELIDPEAAAFDMDANDSLFDLVEDSWNDGHSLRLYFHGQPGSGRRQRAEGLAWKLGTSLLVVDLAGALVEDHSFERVPRLVFREAVYRDALVYLNGFDVLLGDEHSAARERLWNELLDDSGVTLLAGSRPWVPVDARPSGVITIPFSIPEFDARLAQWEAALLGTGVELRSDALEILAGRFRLSTGQIANAVATARNLARWRASLESGAEPGAAAPSLDDLFAAARAQRGHDLAALARKIDPIFTWDDIVLPDDTLCQLREICQRVTRGTVVLDEWGFARKLSNGKGTTALFAGPSGTGKTMAAEIIASELGLDLYKIDLSGVVSKYIGETEKNLERIFQSAENSNAILFFDEADALFGKRSEVRDSHDRYANIETSYLLQKMDEHDGIVILATNLRQNLDDSFVRRMAFTVSFPFPDAASRRLIWEGIWPDETPRSFSMADLDDLAARFKLAGGNIKNVALAASFLAADEERPVCIADLLHAIQREYQKMGKTLSKEELVGIRNEVAA